jgi:hypothetical protein
MLKKVITYTNPFDEKEYTEEFFFNLTTAEVIRLQLNGEEDLAAALQQVIDSGKPSEILKTFEYLIEKSYGVKTINNQFVKTEESARGFMCSEAYSVFLGELITDASLAAEFITKILPKDLMEKALAIAEKSGTETVNLPEEDKRPAWEKEDRDPTKQELINMSTAEMQRAFALRAGRKAVSPAQ